MLRVIKNLSLNAFMIGFLPLAGEKDLLVFPRGALGCVDMNAELKGESDKLLRLSSMTADKKCACVLNADFKAGTGLFNSAAVIEEGEIVGVSDEISPKAHDAGSAFRCYELKEGRVGILLGDDLLFPELWARLAFCAPSLILCLGSYRAELYPALSRLCDCAVCAVSKERTGIYAQGALIKSSFEDILSLPLPKSRRRPAVLTKKVKTSIERT